MKKPRIQKRNQKLQRGRETKYTNPWWDTGKVNLYPFVRLSQRVKDFSSRWTGSFLGLVCIPSEFEGTQPSWPGRHSYESSRQGTHCIRKQGATNAGWGSPSLSLSSLSPHSEVPSCGIMPPTPRGVFPPQLNLCRNSAKDTSEVCLLVDSKSSQVDNRH